MSLLLIILRFSYTLLPVLLSSVLAWEAHALASVSQVAFPGQKVVKEEGWPEGASELVNDPARTNGWNPWFSEHPNDIDYFGYECAGHEDLNRLLLKLSAISTINPNVRLSPASRPEWPGWDDKSRWSKSVCAVLSISDQHRLTRWFENLPEVRPGVRRFGKQEITRSHFSRRPTLTIYVGYPMDWSRVTVPPGLEVVSAKSRAPETDNADISKLIDELISRSKRRPQK